MQIMTQADAPPAGFSIITSERTNATVAASPRHPAVCSFVLSLCTFISLFPRISTQVFHSSCPRERHLDLDLLQTGLVSPHPSYYLLCLAQTNLLLVCRLFLGRMVVGFFSSPQGGSGGDSEGGGHMHSELICLGRRKTCST